MSTTRALQSLWRLRRRLNAIKISNMPETQCAPAIGNLQQQRSYATASLSMAQQLGSRQFATLTTENAKPKRKSAAAAAYNETAPSFELQLNRLEAHYQQHGYLSYEQCQRLLQLLSQPKESAIDAGKQNLSDEQAHFLLGACVPELLPAQNSAERLQLFQMLWQHLDEQQQLRLEHYYIQLEVLRQNQLPLLNYRTLLADIERRFAGQLNDSSLAQLYTAILNVACASGNMRQATELIAEMRTRNYALNEHNFNALILGHARNRDLTGAQSVLDSMTAAGVSPSNETYAVLTLAYLENDATAKALDYLQRFHAQFEARQILQLLRATLRADNTTLTHEVVQQLVRELPKEFVSGADVPLGLRSLCIELIHHKRDLEVVNAIISALPKPRFNDNQNIDSFGSFLLVELFRAQIELPAIIEMTRMLHTSGYNTRALHLATEIALRRQPDSAGIAFLEELAAAGEPLRAHYFWPLMLHNVRRNGEQGVMQTLREMARLKVSCDEETIRNYVIPNLWVTLEQPQLALQQLDECGVRTSQVLLPILVHLLQQNKTDEVLQFCELYPTRLELGGLVQSLTTLAVHTRATKSYQRYAKLLAALSKKALDTKLDFIGALLLQMLTPQLRLRGDITALLQFVNEMERNGLKVSTAAVEQVLSTVRHVAAAAANDNETAEKLSTLSKTLHKMSNNKLSLQQDSGAPNSSSSNTGAAAAAGATGLGNASSFIKHPREMTLDELECHLIELESKKLNARGVLRRLLQLNVREGRLERALQIKTKCDTLRVQTSPGMMASIFDMYIKLKDLPKAQESLKQLQQKYAGFQIDEHKLIDYAALLVYNKQLEQAKQLLEAHAARNKINGGDYVIKNIWQLLNNVAQYATNVANDKVTGVDANDDDDDTQLPQNLTYEMFKFLRQHHYCNTHNAVLGPIIRECLLRGDIKAAVIQFKHLAEQHKHTPLQFELLSILVKLANGNEAELKRFAPVDAAQAQQLLSQVTGIVSRVHGPANMNSALLLAFAESGTENQLRRLIINPEFCINHELLLKNCDHLGQEGAVSTLLRLARGARGLQRVIDEQLIYDMLLTNFTRSNNYVAALDLYERLEADDELKVSQQFLRNLVNLLRVNKREIPSNIALRAQII